MDGRMVNPPAPGGRCRFESCPSARKKDMKYDSDSCENIALIGVWMCVLGIIAIFCFAIFAPTSPAAPFIIFTLILGGALVSCVGVCLMVNK